MSWERRGVAAVATTTLSVVVVNGLATLQAAWVGPPITGAAAVIALPLLAAGVALWVRPSLIVVEASTLVTSVALAAGGLLPWGFVPLLFVVAWIAHVTAQATIAALPDSIDGAWRRSRGKTVAWIFVALVMLLQVSRLSAFMTDRDNTWGSTFPPIEFSVTHMCMGSYVHAGDLTRKGEPNIYAPKHYPSFGIHEADEIETEIDGLQQYFDDAFLYAPAFLLLPRAWLGLSNDYLNIRAVWFAVQFLAFVAFAVFLGRWVAGSGGGWALWLLPLLLGSMPAMFNFQFGQAHLLTIWTAVAAMLAFEKNRPALGGLLLAWGIASKIFPGVLVLYLLFQRRWRDVGWTAAFGVLLVLLTLAVVGTQPAVAFTGYMLPRLASGDAFSFITDPLPILTNLSIPGSVWKLDFLGFEGGNDYLGVASWVYTVFLLVMIWIASRLEPDRLGKAQLWLALLVLASLRSPIVPIYGAVPILWLMTFQFGQLRTTLGFVLFGVSWILVNGVPPAPDPLVTIALTGVAQIAILYWVLLPLRPSATPELAPSQ